MSNRIVAIQRPRFASDSESYFGKFSYDFPYLEHVDLVIPTGPQLTQYEKDLETLDSGWSGEAELIDTRNLAEHANLPTRMLLGDKFFGLRRKRRHEVILHELGHYFTNPALQVIRDFIADREPPKVGTDNSALSAKVKAHNVGLYYLFQIPKMVQETHAELWEYEKERRISRTRLRRYCDDLEGAEVRFNNTKENTRLFYEFPWHNYMLAFRLSVLKHVDFDFAEQSLRIAEEANKAFFDLATRSGWGKLKILEYQDELLRCMDYGNENIERLCSLYDEVFEDYIRTSAQFFPLKMRTSLLKNYGL